MNLTKTKNTEPSNRIQRCDLSNENSSNEHFLMMVFRLFLNRVNVFATFLFNVTEEYGSEGLIPGQLSGVL